MNDFLTIFIFEFKKTINRKNIILFIILLIINLYVMQNGINKYKIAVKNRKIFEKIEKKKVAQYINYSQYGGYGFRILFEQRPINVLFYNSNSFSQLKANVDSGGILNIFSDFKGVKLFEEKLWGFKDLSSVFFIFGTILSIILGFRTFFPIRNIRFLSEFIHLKSVFLYKFISRLLLLLGLILFYFFFSLFIYQLNDLNITMIEMKFILLYFAILISVLLFFFFSGIMASLIRSYTLGITLIIFLWFLLQFILPGIINSVTSIKADKLMSVYDLELKKIKILMDFERKSIEKAGISKQEKNNTTTEREIVERYFKHEFVQLQALEKKLEREIEDNVQLYHLLSSFFPSTFYLSCGNEISSCGYHSFLDFYRYVQQMKRKFLRFYIEKKFYSNFPRREMDLNSKKKVFFKVESFVKSDENIFFPKPSLPGHFLMGILILYLYNLLLFLLSYFRFKNILKK